MARLKAWLRRAFCLPAVPTVIICVPAYVLVGWVLVRGFAAQPLAYAAYALSTYAVVLTCTGLFRTARTIKQAEPPAFVRRALGLPLVRRYMHDEQFSAQLALWRGAALNLLYVGIKLYYGITGRSGWFITLAGYYLVLLLMRASLLHLFRTGSTSPAAALRRVRLCGVLLLAMNIVMEIMVTHIVEGGKGFVYYGSMIYIMALYAFYAVARAASQFVRFGKRKNILLTAVKGLDVVAALVSMLALETAMLYAFGGGDEAFRRMMTGISGGCVCAFVFALALYTLISTTRGLRRLSRN